MNAPLTALLTSFDPDDHPGKIIERVMMAAREHLNLDVAFVSEFENGARIFRYANGDLRRFDLEIEGGAPLDETYCQRICDGTLPAVIPDTSRNPVAAALPATTEMGIEAHVGVPVQFSDGQLYGTLCCISGDPNERLSAHDVDFMRMTAAIVAEQLERDEITKTERRTATQRIRAAIEDGFSIVYQPIVSLATESILGYEALARFGGHLHRGPQEWFAEAWAVGVGAELELAAVAQAVRGLDAIPTEAYLAVNLSPETMLSPDLHALLQDVAAERVVLEITEHAHVFDYRPVADQLAKLRADGFRIAIDDLGTGHAGINHLLQFQPDVLKIDLGVVKGVRHDPVRRAVAATFATLANSIGASVVAEGIENAEDRDALEILGLTAGQGFHIARPAALEHLPS